MQTTALSIITSLFLVSPDEFPREISNEILSFRKSEENTGNTSGQRKVSALLASPFAGYMFRREYKSETDEVKNPQGVMYNRNLTLVCGRITQHMDPRLYNVDQALF